MRAIAPVKVDICATKRMAISVSFSTDVSSARGSIVPRTDTAVLRDDIGCAEAVGMNSSTRRISGESAVYFLIFSLNESSSAFFGRWPNRRRNAVSS